MGEYLAALEEANVGRVQAFAKFVIDAAGRSIRRVIGGSDADAAE